jgi:valyl-tRNA synthetase
MDLRPQGPEIIRTWLFSTVVRSELEHHVLPWRHATINGWVLDPDRKKMSKSTGHASTPMDKLDEISSDGVRYWAASGRPGTDTAEDPAQMKVGRRLTIKLLNASKFVLTQLDGVAPGSDAPALVTQPIDQDLLAGLRDLVEEVTRAFEQMDYARSLERTESFFWGFCDDYLELAKTRAYGAPDSDETRSARAALGIALSVLLRLFAPILPFATEEAWSWWHEGSIHREAWPTVGEVTSPAPGVPGVLEAASSVLGVVRREKSSAKRSMRAEVESVTVRGPAELLAAVESARDDLVDAGAIRELRLEEGEASVIVVLADTPPG